MAPRKPKTVTTEAPAPAVEPTIAAFKGFDPKLQCRGFQYEVGKTYEHAGRVSACASGFHACENPWDVLDHYSMVHGSGQLNRFARVSLSGSLSRDGTTKIAAGRIAIDAELRLPDFLAHAIKWIIDATALTVPVVSVEVAGTATETDSGRDAAKIGSSGYAAQIGSSGYAAKIGSSGYAAKIGSSGYAAKIGSSGYAAQIGSSGDDAKIGSSGDDAKIGSSGDDAKIGSSGDDAKIGSSGYAAKIEATGARAVVACAGLRAFVKAGEDGAICIVWHDGKRSRFAVGYVGEDGIEAGVFYTVRDGKLAKA